MCACMQVGCGVGNAFWPLIERNPQLRVYACDFAPKYALRGLVLERSSCQAHLSCHAIMALGSHTTCTHAQSDLGL